MRSGTAARLEAALSVGLIAAATAALTVHIRYLAPPMVDDAGTSLAYAITLFHGHGLRLTPFSQAVEGFSNPLWVLLSGLAAWSSHPVAIVLAVGEALAVLGAVLVSAWGPVAERRFPQIEDALPVALAAATTCFAYWSAAGLETGLQVFLMSLAGVLLLRAATPGPALGLCLGLLVLTRPEAVLYAAIVGGLVIVRLAAARRWPVRREWLALGLFAGVVIAYQVIRMAWFASWLPNTYYAKAGWDFSAGKYIGSFAREYWAPCATGLALGAIGVLAARTRTRSAAAVGFVLAGVFFTWFAHGDWMREWRFLAPIVPFIGAALAGGLSAARELAERRFATEVRLALAATGTALAVSVVIATARASVPRSRSMKDGPEFSVEYVAQWASRVEKTFAQLGIRHALIATPDLGGNSLTLRNAELIDDAGLADYAMARDLPHQAAREDYLLSEGPPDLVNAHGPSGDVARYHRLLANYDYRSGDFVLRGLTRTADPRCPGGKAAVLAMSARQLAEAVEADLTADNPLDALHLWRCGFRYEAGEALPGWDWRTSVSRNAAARANALEKTKPELALRFLSFATVLSGGDAWLRRRTERLRIALFP